MSGQNIIVIVLAVAASVGVVAWFVLARKFPEHVAGHDEPTLGANVDRSVTPDVAARPAGPDAESMDASRPGGSTPPPPPARADEPRARGRDLA